MAEIMDKAGRTLCFLYGRTVLSPVISVAKSPGSCTIDVSGEDAPSGYLGRPHGWHVATLLLEILQLVAEAIRFACLPKSYHVSFLQNGHKGPYTFSVKTEASI